ncbi:MAG: DUF262 domain-containing protein [Alcaligenaceae bacterium]|nr:DUF262 domain-containing protein [Alcaligenaceae bacterium]
MDNNRLKPKLLTIEELFHDANAVYVVPIYQRNFTWQAEQIEQLLRDVKDAIFDKKDNYFLGNLMVTELQKTQVHFEVIDGQQRLTTLYLLLTILAEDGLTDVEHRDCLRYESRARATQAIQRVSTEALNSCHSTRQTSHTEDAGILQGYKFIRQFMDQHLREETERRQFADFLLKKVVMVRAVLPSKTDFNRYFEIMNTRGQQLQQTDIVKAQLMQHLDNEIQRECFAWVWDACSDMDSYVQMSLTRGDTKLRQAIFGDNWSRLTVMCFEDLVMLSKSANSKGDEGITLSTSLSLKMAITKYAAVNVQKNDGNQDTERFRSIIEFPVFLLHVLKVVNGDDNDQEGQLDDKSLIKTFSQVLEQHDAKKPEWVKKFLFKLLRCKNLFDSFVIKRQFTATNSDDGDWSLQRLIKGGSEKQSTPVYKSTFTRTSPDIEDNSEIDPATRNLLTLQSMLRVTYTSPRTMHWITLLLIILDKNEFETITESQLVDALREYARDKVREAFFKNNEEPMGFSINRIVFTYLDYLIWLEQQNPEYRFSFRNSIEHFYPQRPDKEQSGAKVSKAWLHRLGNLALVNVGVNSKFSNNMPNTKAVNFKETIEQQSPKLQEMAEITRQKNDWGDQEVIEHHTAVLNRLRIDLGLVPDPCLSEHYSWQTIPTEKSGKLLAVTMDRP